MLWVTLSSGVKWRKLGMLAELVWELVAEL